MLSCVLECSLTPMRVCYTKEPNLCALLCAFSLVLNATKVNAVISSLALSYKVAQVINSWNLPFFSSMYIFIQDEATVPGMGSLDGTYTKSTPETVLGAQCREKGDRTSSSTL